MRRLVLLRHASTEDGQGKRDFDRLLTDKGRSQARKMGRWLAAQGLLPDHVVSSPAPRAFETAKLACAELGILPTALVPEERIYDASVPTLLRVLAAVPPTKRCVLLCGHNPGFEQLALHLTGDHDLERTGLVKGAAVLAELPDDWSDLGAKSSDAWLRADPDSV